MPLVVATLLLVVVSVFNRVNESFDRALVLLPLVCLAIVVAAESGRSRRGASARARSIWIVPLIFVVGLGAVS